MRAYPFQLIKVSALRDEIQVYQALDLVVQFLDSGLNLCSRQLSLQTSEILLLGLEGNMSSQSSPELKLLCILSSAISHASEEKYPPLLIGSCRFNGK